MDTMGDKINAWTNDQGWGSSYPRSLMVKFTRLKTLAVAEKIGYPVMLKASAGGGEKVRKVERQKTWSQPLRYPKVKLRPIWKWRYILSVWLSSSSYPKFKVLADQEGHVVHLGETGLFTQRNNQKVLEEKPIHYVGKTLRNEIELLRPFVQQSL